MVSTCYESVNDLTSTCKYSSVCTDRDNDVTDTSNDLNGGIARACVASDDDVADVCSVLVGDVTNACDDSIAGERVTCGLSDEVLNSRGPDDDECVGGITTGNCAVFESTFSSHNNVLPNKFDAFLLHNGITEMFD